jgi:hypothetical protein
MIAPCTKLDQTVNQIRLLCAIGSREAIIKNTPSVAYTPKIGLTSRRAFPKKVRH